MWLPTQNLAGRLTDLGLKFTQPYVAVSAALKIVPEKGRLIPIDAKLVNVNQAKRARCPHAGSCCNVAFRRFRGITGNASHIELWNGCGANPLPREGVSDLRSNTTNQD